MIKNHFHIKENIQPKHLKKNLSNKLNKDFEKILSSVQSDIKNITKTLNVLNKDFQFNFKTKNLKKFKKYNSIALIGMGGSILGIEAIYNFLQDKIKKKIYFFDDLNEIKISNFKKMNLSKILFIITSKSGHTIETLSNTFALNIIKKNAKNIILISEKNNSQLYLLSKKLNLFYVEHNKFIGGRYSVLSEVGIVPAYLMGLDIVKLRSNILECLNKKNQRIMKLNSTKLANLMNSRMFSSLVFLNYSPKLEKFLYWCQQLIAESLGKKYKGLLPVISNVPKDHHSLMQLYLDGPKDKIFNIFSLKNKFEEKIYINKKFGLKSFLHNKKIREIKDAQMHALIKSLKKKKIPFREIKVGESSERVIGELFAFFIVETIIVGKLLRLNPFDQPAVEQVKIFTKQLLK